MVYVDPIHPCVPNEKWKYHFSCHLFGDTVEELDRFAKKLGMKPEWRQDHGVLVHYDLTPEKRQKAVDLGAQEERWMDAWHRIRKNQK